MYPHSTVWNACLIALDWGLENTDYYQKMLPNERFSNNEITQYPALLHENISDQVIKECA